MYSSYNIKLTIPATIQTMLHTRGNITHQSKNSWFCFNDMINTPNSTIPSVSNAIPTIFHSFIEKLLKMMQCLKLSR